MASEKDSSCHNYCANDPNFAIICSFFDRFSSICGITHPTFSELQEMVESTQDVPPELIDLHIKLLRKIRRSVATEKWERALVKFLHAYYCSEDGWELERCGYKKCKVAVRLRILKTLLDAQFDLNTKFKADINKLSAEELRIEPFGRDKVGQSYWCQFDSAANIRIYKEDQDEETWKLVVKDREGMVELITQLSSTEELLALELVNEDSNSLEIEKPIIDTGQIQVSTSEENTADNISDVKSENKFKQEESSSLGSHENGLDANNCVEPALVKSDVDVKEPALVKSDVVVKEPALINSDVDVKEPVLIHSDVDVKEPALVNSDVDVKEPALINSDVDVKEPALINSDVDVKDTTLSSNQAPHSCVKSDEKLLDENSLKTLDPELENSLQGDDDTNNSEKSSRSENSQQFGEDLTVKHNLKYNETLPQESLNTKTSGDNPPLNQIFEHRSSSIDVAEEIKQRSLSKSNNLTHFKGKMGKLSFGSKLDQIFSRKLEQSNIGFSLDRDTKCITKEVIPNFADKTRTVSQQNISNDDESSSQKSFQSDEKENELSGKRKPEDMVESNCKKKCLDTESDDEVGEEIEEPVMIIKGEGSGQDCDTGNPDRDNEDSITTTENMNKVPPADNDIKLTNKPKDTTPHFENCKVNSNEIDTQNENLSDDVNETDRISGVLFNNDNKSQENCEEVNTTFSDSLKEAVENHSSGSKDVVSDSSCTEDTSGKDKSCSKVNSENGTDWQEKSIEEQLSDITGECFSPKDVVKANDINDSEKHDAILSKNLEKGNRRKSLDNTDSGDVDVVPPDAKKTRIRKDSIEIFGCIDESTSDEDKQHLAKELVKELKVLNKSNRINNCGDSENKRDKESVVNKKKKSSKKDGQILNISKQEINCFEEPLDRSKKLRNKRQSVNEKEEDDENVQEVLEKRNKEGSTSEQDSCKKLSNSLAKNCVNKDPDTSEGVNQSESTCKSKICDNSDKDSSDSLNDTNVLAKNEILHKNKVVGLRKKEKKVTNNSKKSKKKSKKSTIVKTEDSDDLHILEKHDINEESENEVNENSLNNKKPGTKENDSKAFTENITNECSEHIVKKKEINGPTKVNPVTEKSNDSSSVDDEEHNNLKEHSNSKVSPKKHVKPRRKVFTPKSRKKSKKINLKSEKENPKGKAAEEAVNTERLSPEETSEKDLNEQQSEALNENQSQINKKTKELAKVEEVKPVPVANRKRRSSRRNTTEKDSEEDIFSDKKENEEEEEEIGGKRRKLKGKRTPNKTLRKSVEDKRNTKSSSEEEAHPETGKEKGSKKSPGSTKQKSSPSSTGKNSGKNKNNTSSPPKTKKSSEPQVDSEESDKAVKKKKSSKVQGRHSRAFLGIDLNIDLSDTSRSVRQSSRLAQIKIKEQAEVKHVDENRPKFEKPEKKLKKKKKKEESEEKQKGTLKKKKKAKVESEDEVREEELPEKKKGRKKKRKNPVKAFNERDPWKSSSGSSSEVEEEEEDHFDEIVEEEEELNLELKSDHEFSPESDLEGEDEVKPVRRARTAQKVSEPSTEDAEESKDVDDFACEKCGKKDHPEWILLCDTCDHGWHASCLRPSLMLIPEGDWHCPPCQHTVLVKRLQETLRDYDRDTKRRENEELRKKRLAYVGISLDNVLPSNSHQQHRPKTSGSESSETSESSESESESSDEPVYQLRQRRQGTTSYRFNEYDDLINSAIQDEVEVKHGIAGIVTENNTDTISKVEETKANEIVTPENNVEVKEGEDNSVSSTSQIDQAKLEKPKSKDKGESGDDSSYEEDNANDEEEEEEFPRVVPRRNNILPRPGKKKHRRLNCLDDQSDDDGSDEDFKGSSSEEEEEDDDEEDDSDDSDTGRRGRSKRGHLGPVRRSSRARRSRFDKEFINDNSDESDAPRRKKTKKLWSDTDSESDDSTWGRRKKKKNYSSSGRRKFKKNKKFIIEDELSETETSKVPKKKRQRKVKYGGLDDLAVEELPARRTRGKKINYQEVIGSDTDEDIQKPKNLKRAVIDDEDDFVADKEEEKEESETSSGEEVDPECEEKSSDDVEEGAIIKDKEHPPDKPTSNIPPPVKISPPVKIPPPVKVSPPKGLVKDKPPGRRGRPPKAMIAPPPERLLNEDEQYKAVVSKVPTLGHPNKSNNDKCDVGFVKTLNFNDDSNNSLESKDFLEHSSQLSPLKIQNNSFDSSKFRSPPIKIRSGVPVNTGGRKSPSLSSPTSETSFFPVKPINLGINNSSPEKIQLPLQVQRTLMPIQTSPQPFSLVRKPVNPPPVNVKTETLDNEEDLDDLDEEDLMDDIEEEEDDEDDSEDDVLEEGEIPKKVARRMARMEERMQKLEERKLARQMKEIKPAQAGAVTIQPVSPGDAQPPGNTSEQKPVPKTQPTQPLLRVVSPFKLMANPPNALQSSFIHPGLSPRMPMASPPPARMPMQMRPPQPANMMPVMGMDEGSPGKRRGRGRGKKQIAQEKTDQDNMISGVSVIRGMLQQPQSYPPTHYPQQYPPHPRIPFNPQRMPRPPFHPGHHPLDPSPSGGGTVSVKQEPGNLPPSNPIHIPNKPPQSSAPPFHGPPPPHRFDSRQANYAPQGMSPHKPQYGSYPPPPAQSTNYHYGSYPPPMNQREEPQVYSVQQPYNEPFSDQQPAASDVPAGSKGYAEEESGEFGGLVSYFSSQREDDIDT